MKKIIAVLLSLLLLCGCSAPVTESTQPPTEATQAPTEAAQPTEATEPELPEYHFSQMEYVRPDATALNEARQACEAAVEAASWEQLSAAVPRYLEEVSHVSTMCGLAMIHCSLDLTDEAWAEENAYCSELIEEVKLEDATLCRLLAATEYADQLQTEEYFGPHTLDLYKDQDYLTDEVQQLLIEDAQLQSQYYVLSEGITPHDVERMDPLADLLAQMVIHRKKIADAAGFDSYADFAYEYDFHRDFSSEEAWGYIEQVRTEILPLFMELGVYGAGDRQPLSGTPFNYVKELSQNLGGTFAQAFEQLETGELYDLGFSSKKLGAGFSCYLSDYGTSYIFMNPASPAGFTHEFGHFCDGYAGDGAMRNVDAAEVYSQGLEYLSMFYGDGTQNDVQITSLLNVYVASAANAEFELRLYEMPVEEVTGQSVVELYQQVGKEWGSVLAGSFNKPSLLLSIQYFVDPMYMLSYSISSDVALQLCQLEMDQPGAGVSCYEKLLASDQLQLLALAEDAGLRSPFEEGAIQKSRDAFKALLGGD